MLNMPNTLLQLRIPEQYIKTLAEDSDSVRYRNSKSQPQLGLWDKVKIFLWPSHYYTELYQFYPFHPVIKQSKEQYDNDHKSSIKNGAYISFGLSLLIYQFGRRAKTAPIYSRYSRFLGFHRLFWQYLSVIVLPATILQIFDRVHHFDNLLQLQSTHARRMYQGILNDPEGTEYPSEIKRIDSFGKNWISIKVAVTDLKKKSENECALQFASDYENTQFQAVDIGQGEKEEGQEQGQGQAEEE